MEQNNQLGGSVTSVEDLVRQTLGKVLGQFVPGGNGIVNMMMPFARSLTGNDVAWDTPVYSDMNTSGIYRHQVNTQLRNLSQIVANTTNTNITRDIVRDIERTKMSFEDWQARNPDLDRKDYDAAIESATEQAMRNRLYSGVVSLGNRTFNLNGTAGMADSLGMMATNMARFGARRGDNNAMLFGRYLAENLFTEAETNEQGQLLFERRADNTPGFALTHAKSFKREEWGNFGQKAISDLAAGISRDLDLISGVNTDNADEISVASEHFKSMLHEYAQALEPLKDVFGEDMTSIIGSMEKMSGMSMTALGPARAAAMANDLSARVNNGAYSFGYMMNNIKGAGDWLMQQDGMTSSMYLQQTGLGILESDLAQGAGVKPSYMTEQQWQAYSRRLSRGAATSRATEAFADHYAIWAHKQEIENPEADRSFEEFVSRMQPMLEKGVDSREAAAQLSGAFTAAERQQGRAYAYRAETISSGKAATLSIETDMVQRRKQVAQLARNSTPIKALFRTNLGKNDTATIDEVMNMAFRMIEEQPEIQTDSPEAIVSSLERLYGRNLSDTQLKAAKDQWTNVAPVLGAVINFMKEAPESNAYGAYVRNAGQYAGRRAQVKSRVADEERNMRFDAARKKMFNASDGIMQLFDGGFSYQTVMERLRAGQAIVDNNEQGKDFDWRKLDPDNTAALMHAAGESAKVHYKDDKRAAYNYAKRMFTYGTSAQGRSGKFQLELSNYRQALEEGRHADAEDIRARMDAYMTFGEANVDRFLNLDTLKGISGVSKVDRDLWSKDMGDVDKLRALQNVSKDDLAMAFAQQDVDKMSDDSKAGKQAKKLFKKFARQDPVAGESLEESWTNFRNSILGEAQEDYNKRLTSARKKQGMNAWVDDSELKQTQSAMAMLDKIMGVAGQGITASTGPADNLELVTVLRSLNDTLMRMNTDTNGVLRNQPAQPQTTSQDNQPK